MTPAGCPTGSRPRFAVLADKKVAQYSEPLVNALIKAAATGDMAAWRIIAEREWRPRKGRPIEIALPKVVTLGDVLARPGPDRRGHERWTNQPRRSEFDEHRVGCSAEGYRDD